MLRRPSTSPTRRVLDRLLLALGALCLAACGDAAPEDELDPLRSDPRIVDLLAPCQRGGFYDRFVDDLVPILVDKLSESGGDPLKRAKEELGELGDRSAPALRRRFDENFANASRSPVLENVLDAAAMNDSDVAHDVVRRALDHPMETVRYRALQGMVARHARAEEFDDLRRRVSGNETFELRRLFLRSLFEADAVRAEEYCIEVLRAGDAGPLQLDMVQRLGESTRRETADACVELYDQIGPPSSVWLAAPAARFELAGALEYLRSELLSEDPNRRLGAVRALTSAGRLDDLAEPLATDPNESVRLFALTGIASADPLEDRHVEWLSAALADGAKTVRDAALKELCRLGDAAAIDLALSFLLDEAGLMQGALTALREPLLEDPVLARRTFEVLLERHRLEELRPIVERATTYKAMGLVPTAEAAQFLREQALGAEDERQEVRIEGLRVHDWMMIHASNTGSAGRDQLWSELAEERDPLRRIDLISAVSSTRDRETRAKIRERMLGLAEDTSLAPLERLYAATRAIRVGPSWIVAPRLKPLTVTFEDPRVQVALQCHLWRWY